LENRTLNSFNSLKKRWDLLGKGKIIKIVIKVEINRT
jgi:hypothetical protein